MARIEKEQKPVNWEKRNAISNMILTILTFFALLFAIWSAFIANNGVSTQIDVYKLETTPKIAMLVDFEGSKSINYEYNRIEVDLKSFMSNPHLSIQFYNEGRIPVMIGSVSAIGSCLTGTWLKNESSFMGITVYGGRRVIQPFEFFENKTISLLPFLNESITPCEIILLTQIHDRKMLGSKVLIKK